MSRFTGPVTILICVATAFALAPSASAAGAQAPSIVISAPTPGSAASGTVSVSGSASGRRRIKRVAISVDGGSFSAATGTSSWSKTLNTSSYPDGQHIVKAKATDIRGYTRSVSISVNFTNGASSGRGSVDSMVTPEGTHIDVNTAGSWTADQVYQMLKA